LLTLNSTPSTAPCSMWHLSRIGLSTYRLRVGSIAVSGDCTN
jgi:hypothetical protein